MKEQDQMQARIRETIDEHLRRIGVSTNVDGFGYLKEAIAIAVENPKLLMENTKVIYYNVAEHFGKTYSQVEKVMRHAIETAFYSEHENNQIHDYFGNTISFLELKPTNLEFIAAVKEQVIEESHNMKMAGYYLREYGIVPRLRGYQYLKMWVALALEDHSIIALESDEPYYKLAEIFYQKPKLVQKAITNAIYKAHEYQGVFRTKTKWRKAFGFPSLPTNFEFVKYITNQIIKNEEM